MKFELHCHSTHSRGKKIPFEGTVNPKAIIKHAKSIGLSGIALTDHNNSNGWKEAKEEAKKQDILFIPGIEISSLGGTEFHTKGHMIGLGLNENIEKGLGVKETVDRIHEQGGIAIAPHPFDLKNTGLKEEMKKTDAVEIFNSLSIDKISNFIAERKADKFGLSKVASSDAHTLDMIGNSVIKSGATDMDSLLKEIKNGYVGIEKRYATLKNIIDWSWERIIKSQAHILEYVTDNYWTPKKEITEMFLDKFVNNPEHGFWKFAASIGLANAYVYSAFKNMRWML
ncbi:MAG: PHP domain-containing protein [Candidatus Aenigmarchaeota archaeon]|nr:PHP domain-containing protein [Candidatus Aenigmarchaeota archaeon]